MRVIKGVMLYHWKLSLNVCYLKYLTHQSINLVTLENYHWLFMEHWHFFLNHYLRYCSILTIHSPISLYFFWRDHHLSMQFEFQYLNHYLRAKYLVEHTLSLQDLIKVYFLFSIVFPRYLDNFPPSRSFFPWRNH